MVTSRSLGKATSGGRSSSILLECWPSRRYFFPVERSTPQAQLGPPKVWLRTFASRNSCRAGRISRSPGRGVIAAHSRASSRVRGTPVALIFLNMGSILSIRWLRLMVRPRPGFPVGVLNEVELFFDPVEQLGLETCHHIFRIPAPLLALVAIGLAPTRDFSSQVLIEIELGFAGEALSIGGPQLQGFLL